VQVQGNRVLSGREIRNALNTLREGTTLMLSGKDDPKLEDDITRLRILLADHGYARPNIGVEIKALPTGGGASPNVDVVITIEEKAQYRIGKIEVTGNKVLQEKDIKRAIKDIRSGAVFNDTQLRKSFETLKEAYGRNGYVGASFNRKHVFDDPGKVIHLSIDIDEGRQYRLGEIRVTGNRLFTDEAIKKDWPLRTGDIFDTDKLEISIEKVRKLYGKRANVNARMALNQNPRIDSIDLTIEILEGPIFRIAVSGP
jgi:outer membrane protein insertion porin family